jgi:hypothetical protein
LCWRGRCRSGCSGSEDRIDILVGVGDDREQRSDWRGVAFVRQSLAKYTISPRDELHHRLVSLYFGEDIA